MPMSRLLAGTAVRSRPPTLIVPASCRSRPARIRSTVVLPHPDGPSSTTISPGSMCRSRPSRARTSPYERRSPVICTATPLAWGAGGAGVDIYLPSEGRRRRSKNESITSSSAATRIEASAAAIDIGALLLPSWTIATGSVL